MLLIVADDLGFSDLGQYGGEIETPNLDRLAKQGGRLTQFYTTGRCCPSRASILTGQYPHRVGLGHMTQDIGRPGYRGALSEDAITVAQALGEAGYRSFISGKWHLGVPDPTRHGLRRVLRHARERALVLGSGTLSPTASGARGETIHPGRVLRDGRADRSRNRVHQPGPRDSRPAVVRLLGLQRPTLPTACARGSCRKVCGGL